MCAWRVTLPKSLQLRFEVPLNGRGLGTRSFQTLQTLANADNHMICWMLLNDIENERTLYWSLYWTWYWMIYWIFNVIEHDIECTLCYGQNWHNAFDKLSHITSWFIPESPALMCSGWVLKIYCGLLASVHWKGIWDMLEALHTPIKHQIASRALIQEQTINATSRWHCSFEAKLVNMTTKSTKHKISPHCIHFFMLIWMQN